MPASFANIEHKCETPGAKDSMEQCSFFEPISETAESRDSEESVEPSSETSETKSSEEVYDAMERILDEGMTDKMKRDEAARLSVGVPLPWIKREVREARDDKTKNPFADPNLLPAPALASNFKFGECNSNGLDPFLKRHS